MHMVLKATYHVLYFRKEAVCNNFLEIKVTISYFGFLMHFCSKFQPEADFNGCVWNSQSGCDKDTYRLNNTEVI